jgi:WhiB family redox-sensing transcriptional regulator
VKARSTLELSPGAAGPLLREDLSWQDEALCQYTDPESFFVEKGGNPAPAKRVCRSCDVRVTCLQWALDNREPFGILGGLSEQQRRGVLQRGLTAEDAIAEDDDRRMRKAGQISATQVARNARERQQRAEAAAQLKAAA